MFTLDLWRNQKNKIHLYYLSLQISLTEKFLTWWTNILQTDNKREVGQRTKES